MPTLLLDSGAELEYEHIPIYASANAIVGSKYFTKLWVLSGGKKYPMGEWDEKLDEDTIKAKFVELIRSNQERQYGTQRPMLRRDLPSRRDRGTLGSPYGISQPRKY